MFSPHAMGASNVHAHYNFIKQVKNCKSKNRKNYLSKASLAQIRSLCECVNNVYSGSVPVSPHIIEKLRPYSKSIKRLTYKRGKAEQKRKYLIQEGGFLPILLGAVLPILGQLVANAIS